jgi:hypothetical protein
MTKALRQSKKQASLEKTKRSAAVVGLALFSRPEIRLAAYAKTDSRRPALCGCGKEQRRN